MPVDPQTTDPHTPPVPAHSIAEAFLYVSIARCPRCDAGPLKAAGELVRDAGAVGGWRLPVACGACRRESTLYYEIDPPPSRADVVDVRLNPTPHRSRAIDLLGWLTLFRTILKASQDCADKSEARRLAAEAIQCLDEALKFYDEGNDLPPREAFFTAESRSRFETHPEQFLRTKWLHHRSLLPNLFARTQPGPTPSGKRRWWRFWRREPSP